MPPFECPRCGRVSAHPQDYREGYCGHCGDWTGVRGPAAALTSRVQLLTPQVLLESPHWAYGGTEDEGQTTVYRFSTLTAPGPLGTLVPDISLGPFTATWCDDLLTLQVSTEVMARAALELLPRSAEIAAGTISAERLASGPLTWDRPDSDPLADLQEAVGHIEAAAAAFDFGAVTAGEAYRAWREARIDALPDLAGRSIEAHGTVDQAGLDALGNEIRRGLELDSPSSWVADAVEVWEGCKDPARRERSLAELAQDVADATPQIRPSESGTDPGTEARWSPKDPGDIIL